MSEPKQQRALLTRQKLLDAAVEELLERGYARLTTANVAKRARVSRGAQQHHFASKDELLVEAVDQLARRQIAELAGDLGEARDREDLALALDRMFRSYAGPLFAATLELSLGARESAELAEAIEAAEERLGREIQQIGRRILAGVDAPEHEIDRRWGMVISSTRGYAMLGLLRHPPSAVRRQWEYARDRLIDVLLEPAPRSAAR